MSELTRLDEHLWVSEQPLKFLGAEVGARMAVVRLSSGGLWVYSPVRPSEPLRRTIDALGPVAHVVAPNRFHHLFIQDWIEAYPRAIAHAAPGLPKKRRDVRFGAVLDEAPGPWAPELEHIPLRGQPLLNEVVFFHKPSRTLICADAVHNVGAEKPWTSKIFYTLVGGYGGFKTNLLDRIAARDRPALRESMRQVLAWDIERVVMGHGVVLERGGRAALRAAYHWLDV